MRFLIISDSHGDTGKFEKVISSFEPDGIIHLGDIERDFEYIEYTYPQIPIYGVLGNNDPYSSRETEKVYEIEGVKIFMTHGHLYGVWDMGRRIAARAEELGCSVALFGHSHVAHYEIFGNVQVFNPGSISRPRQGRASVGVMEIENGKASFVICDWI